VNRREFLIKLTVLGVLVAIPNYAISRAWYKWRRKINILHTNDFHSYIEPFNLNDSRYAGKGGIARIKTLIDAKRDENTLLLDCGDIMQGTPYFNIFGGAVEIEWMNKAKYNAATIGNHDFDNGMESLAKWIKEADFPFLNCNYETKGTELEGLLKPYIIKQVNKRRIGIIGVGIDPEGLVPAANCKGVVYLDPVHRANERAKELKKTNKVDMVILLSHLGFQYRSSKIDDCKLAAQSKHIDLILGGHTHTFMDEPHVVKNLKGKKVIIHQVGWAGLKLGHLEFRI